MLDINQIREYIEEMIGDRDLFVIDIKSSTDNIIEVLIDSDSSVSIEDCIALGRAVNEKFDREDEDYELTVASAGIGQPLRLLRQYRKLIGRPVELLLKSGTKFIARLEEATDEGIRISYEEKVAVEGQKRKQTVRTEKSYAFDEVKWTKEYLDFK